MTPIVQVIGWLITCLFHQRQGAHCCYGIVGAGRWQMGTAHDRRLADYQRYSHDKEMADAFY
ncbi:hypothetical protein [Acidithiobacillus ferriphilus]|jgi:hypothetical protein|uniref:hypothetical protein n=1 Tax=Acidithiobacillus ferriphilus TaxID=1689834 RepID=UPI00232C1A7D|nr:hypothetical protein [Acidithiobacillus ferriphilus]WCE94676.1 hypothetical protein PJU76_03800 [Acidithiobacillus ferriphilus]